MTVAAAQVMAPANPAPKAHWAGLSFLTLAVLTSVIDASVMTVATPTIARTFHADLATVEWTTTIYSLFFGATMLLWGKMGTFFGHRRLFVAGNLLFAVSSALVGWAPNLATMIAMRALQGTGAAMFNPAAIALIAFLFPPQDRAMAYGINGVATSVGVALGYMVGGWCAEYWGWRWAFYINVPICIVAAIGVWLFVPRTGPTDRRPLDAAGAVASLAGLGLLIFGLSEGESSGWWKARGLVRLFGRRLATDVSPAGISAAAGVLLLVWFVGRERRLRLTGRQPVFDITLFALPSFRWGAIAGMLRYLAQFSVNYGVALYLQIDDGVPALKAALISLPNALAGMIAAPLGGWLAPRVGVARAVQAGLALQAVGIAWVWHILAPSMTVWRLVGPFAIFGFGSGLASAQLNTASLQDVDSARTSDAASAITTLRQLGASFAVAIFGLITSTTLVRLAAEGYDRTETGTIAMRNEIAAMLLVSLLCVGLSILIPNRRQPRPANEKNAT